MTKDFIFTRFVEPGRLAVVRYGAHANKLVTIVDLIDLKRVVVDGAGGASDVTRQQIPIKWLALTSETCSIQRAASEKNLKKHLVASGAVAKFQGSRWGQRLAQQAKVAKRGDFDRFKSMLAKKKVGHAVRTAVKKLHPKKK